MGLTFIGPKYVLENNTFAWNGKGGARLNGPGHIVRGNTFACNGQVGFQGSFCNKLLFENNRVAFNNIERFANTWGAAGSKIITSKDMVIRTNVYERNLAAAVWMDISCMRATVIHNIVRRNDGLGIFNELGHEGIIAFNVCSENAVGIMLADTSGVRVWNNTLVGNNKSILVKDSPRVNDGTAEVNSFYNNFKRADMEAGARWVTRDNEIKNNLMVGGGRAGSKSAFVDATFAAGSDTSSQMIRSMDGNVYVRLPQGQPTVLVRWDPGMAKPRDFSALAAFQSAYPATKAARSCAHSHPANCLSGRRRVISAEARQRYDRSGRGEPAQCDFGCRPCGGRAAR
jgi:parallel beta-helix repeat protein